MHIAPKGQRVKNTLKWKGERETKQDIRFTSTYLIVLCLINEIDNLESHIYFIKLIIFKICNNHDTQNSHHCRYFGIMTAL